MTIVGAFVSCNGVLGSRRISLDGQRGNDIHSLQVEDDCLIALEGVP